MKVSEGKIVFPKGTMMLGAPNGDLVIQLPNNKWRGYAGIKNEHIMCDVKRFFATKDNRSWFAFKRFKHSFKHQVCLVYHNSKVLILHSGSGKKLWKVFNYGTVSKEEYQQLQNKGVEILI